MSCRETGKRYPVLLLFVSFFNYSILLFSHEQYAVAPSHWVDLAANSRVYQEDEDIPFSRKWRWKSSSTSKLYFKFSFPHPSLTLVLIFLIVSPVNNLRFFIRIYKNNAYLSISRLKSCQKIKHRLSIWRTSIQKIEFTVISKSSGDEIRYESIQQSFLE